MDRRILDTKRRWQALVGWLWMGSIQVLPLKIVAFVDPSWSRRADFIFLHAVRRKGVDSPEGQRL
jgi:hypothetical protein